MHSRWFKRDLVFHQPIGTSRGGMDFRRSWFLVVGEQAAVHKAAAALQNGWAYEDLGCVGIGEVSPLPGLSPDLAGGAAPLEQLLGELCSWKRPWDAQGLSDLQGFPALRAGVHMALRDLEQGGQRRLFGSVYRDGGAGIRTNGLIWMGEISRMWEAITSYMEQMAEVVDPRPCIKMKVGQHDFSAELELLQRLRATYGHQVEVRLDANGAFSERDEALTKLEQLARFDIHSIEQPIPPGRWKEMAAVIHESPIKVALDEELIGIEEVEPLLEALQPPYLVLKPGLIGGHPQAQRWIDAAQSRGIGWWVTSSLESSIGLNAVAQFVGCQLAAAYSQNHQQHMAQGLGTGRLYKDNFPSLWEVRGEHLWYLARPGED